MPLEVSAQPLPCPFCGYDLRATKRDERGIRCPECGKTITARLIASDIPWVQRRHLGHVRAWWRTTSSFIFHPAQFGAQEGHVAIRDAKSFHRVSLLLAILLGALLLGGTFLVRGDQWNEYLKNAFTSNFDPLGEAMRADTTGKELRGSNSVVMALSQLVLADCALVLIPITCTLGPAFSLSMMVYRLWATTGHRHRPRKRRAARLAYYASAILPVESLFLGMAALLAMIGYDHESWFGGMWWLQVADGVASAILCLASLLVLVVPAWLFMKAAMQEGFARRLLFVFFYPVVLVFTWTVCVSVVFAMVGYAAIAIWSSIR